MSPWVRADAATGTTGATGSVSFDVPGDLELGLFDDPVDHTPLNFDIPNIGLGAVLKIFDDNLTRGCRVRLPAVPSAGIDIISSLHRGHGPDDSGVGVAEQIVVQAKSQLRESLLAKLRSTGLSVQTRDHVAEGESGADVLDLSRSLCLVKTGPMTSSGSFHRQFWVMFTGKDARELQFLADEEAGEEGARKIAVEDVVELSESSPERLSAIETIEQLVDTLQVPAETVLRAAGIKRRTYQHWKQTGATPRLASQSRLWDLVLTVRGWENELGDDLAAWVRQPGRLDLLETGAFDDLTNQVLSHQLRLIEPSERHYRDRLAAGYFESMDRELAESEPPAEEANSSSSSKSSERPIRRARRARRAGSPERS